MGVQHLNSLLRAHCTDGIRRITLGDLSGKKIAIDTSIYMYRFLEQGSLIENMFVLVNMLLKYNITPVFVFDGKSSAKIGLELFCFEKLKKILSLKLPFSMFSAIKWRTIQKYKYNSLLLKSHFCELLNQYTSIIPLRGEKKYQHFFEFKLLI